MNHDQISSRENVSTPSMARSVWSVRHSRAFQNEICFPGDHSRAETKARECRALQTLRAIGKRRTVQLWTMLLVALTSTVLLLAQDQQPPVLPDNGAMPGDDFDQPDDMGTNDVGEASALIQTNSSGQSTDNSGSNRRRRGSRRRSPQTSSYSSRDNSAPGPDTIDDRSGRPSYQNFRIVTERNIFDPNRSGYRPPSSSRGRSTDYFALVGTMSYEKGLFAFFDGTSSEYRKALKLGDSIANYKVTNITPNTVNIASGTNQVELRVGMQMRREEQGPWSLGGSSQTFANSSDSTTSTRSSSDSGASTSTASSADENEVLKRLRERREKE
jgi:hypothetical protein